MRILITGVAGFIGFHLATELSKKKHQIIGLDNLNNYYSPKYKSQRLNLITNVNDQTIETNYIFVHQTKHSNIIDKFKNLKW